MPTRSVTCLICGTDRKACTSSTSTDHLDPVDLPEETVMARKSSKLVRVERTTDTGTKYLEKVREGDTDKVDETAAVVTSKTTDKRKA